jgi:hypothetical protein
MISEVSRQPFADQRSTIAYVSLEPLHRHTLQHHRIGEIDELVFFNILICLLTGRISGNLGDFAPLYAGKSSNPGGVGEMPLQPEQGITGKLQGIWFSHH